MTQPTLFDLVGAPPSAPADQAARDFAVDPANDVVLEASAGTGKTRVLVERYVRLLEAGVDPRHILAMTFTRKAAAEMRDRVLADLARCADTGRIAPDRWRDLRERMGDIQILTIDAFCFSLLREFPLEAGVDPAFDVADETEMARFADEALDLTFGALRGIVTTDEAVRLLLARVRLPVLRGALASLLDRRHVMLPAIQAFVGRQAAGTTSADIAADFRRRLRGHVLTSRHRTALLQDGPHGSPEFRWLAADLEQLSRDDAVDPASVALLRRRLETHFLTQAGEPRQRLARALSVAHFASAAARTRHEEAVRALSPVVVAELNHLDRAIDGLLARGLLKVVAIAAAKYDGLLEEYAVLDFAGMLNRTVALLERQEEFARSRLKLQSRYQHVLVDEFQDTSRRQWRLIELLIDAWGEGEGPADTPTSIFVVGDRKQSIYRFRHAEVTLLDEAARKIGALRPGRQVRQAIRTSFRAVPELLAFVNALAQSLDRDTDLPERFVYAEQDQFPLPPVAPGARRDGQPVLGMVAEASIAECARGVADEIASLIGHAVVRERHGAARVARPDDIAILFRARAGHQFFEEALEARGIRTYVYKGLGFFDAPEVQDLQALIRYLARPDSSLRAAEFLRSRIIRLSDSGLMQLAPGFAAALTGLEPPADVPALSATDAALLAQAQAGARRWLALADRLPPGELIDIVLRESAYIAELRGRRLAQAVENIKKVRALVSRVESRGYTTVGRLAAYFDTLRAGEESNAVIDATGAVSLMTIHAAKGLEFPIVFVVNLQAAGRGRPGGVFRASSRGPDGEPQVTFGATDATALEERRDAEELRRLFYVAITRARDRLYFSADIDASGRLASGPRSLASLLPADLQRRWRAPARWLPVERSNGRPIAGSSRSRSAGRRQIRNNRRPRPRRSWRSRTPWWPSRLLPPWPREAEPSWRLPACRLRRRRSRHEGRGLAGGFPEPPVDERLLGTLVHRLFQHRTDPGLPEPALIELAGRRLPVHEGLGPDDRASLCRDAVTLYRAFRSRPDVVGLLGSGECHYEVPFFYDPPERPAERVRGVVDCVVIAPDGSATVVEFKTGRPKAEHEAQAAWYARAGTGGTRGGAGADEDSLPLNGGP